MAKKTKAETLTVPGVLSFERKLSPSDARMFSSRWDGGDPTPRPLKLSEKSVRGTISNRLKTAAADDPAKIDAEMRKPNLQRVDTCNLPEEHDTLVVRLTVKVQSQLGQPTACNSSEFRESLAAQVAGYLERTGARDLGVRYATNLANGRWLWRNRVGAEFIEVTIQQLADPSPAGPWTFDAASLGLTDFEHEDAGILQMGDLIAKTLTGDRDFLLLDVTARVKLGASQEVYPSQEIMQDAPSGKGAKSKFLYAVDGVAAMHSQKIGNAIRTIDTWYTDEVDARPIAVESYGSVTTEGRAYRDGKAADHFYKLFDRWSTGGPIDPPQEHYVVAMLVRGGVFGKSEKES